MLKMFYDGCYEGNLELAQLEKENKIKRLGEEFCTFLINPLYLDEVEKKLSEDIEANYCFEELAKHMQEEYTDYNYDGTMELNTMYNNTFSINISTPIELLTDGNNPEIYEYENEIYSSDEPYKTISEKIDQYGRFVIESQLKDMLRQVNTASFGLV
ncbi:hypothetical protein [uncultured Clostridium sp.]|uniref:hypothetical protein n=1 Tax=uncultured Clostridium sp. TaxID=59620 RepID=UPI00321712FF